MSKGLEGCEIKDRICVLYVYDIVLWFSLALVLYRVGGLVGWCPQEEATHGWWVGVVN